MIRKACLFPRPGRCRPGFTLLEMLAVMAFLGAILTLGITCLVGAFQAERTASSTMHRLTARNTLADQFRDDVNQAVSAGTLNEQAVMIASALGHAAGLPQPGQAGWVAETMIKASEQKAGPTRLVLRLADDTQVVYLWEKNQLMRSQLSAGNSLHRPLPVGPEITAVDFLRSGPDQRLITLKLTESRGRATHPIEIAAALGGDVR